MANGELTYDDFLQRLNIQDVLIDAGYHLNRRDGLRYPSYIRTDSNGDVASSPHTRSSIISSPLSRRFPKNFRNIETACLPTDWSTLSATDC